MTCGSSRQKAGTKSRRARSIIGVLFFAAIIGTLNAAAVAPFSNDHPRGAQRRYGALIAFAVPIMHSVADGAQLTFDRSGSRTFRFR